MMKRSLVNQKIKQGIQFLESFNFKLPPFAFWSVQKWKNIMTSPKLRKKYGNIIERGLGWDMTDRGLGRFNEIGLLLFTLRNGKSNTHRDYAEKILLIQEQQVTPWHYHWKKCEDIINRGGGVLMSIFRFLLNFR